MDSARWLIAISTGGTDRFLEALLAQAGVKGDRFGRLLRRRRVWNEREAWFFINPTADAETASIRKGEFSGVIDLLGACLLEENGDAITVRVGATNLACLLLSR